MGGSKQMVKDLLQFKAVEDQEEQSQLNQIPLVAQEWYLWMVGHPIQVVGNIIGIQFQKMKICFLFYVSKVSAEKVQEGS